MNNHTMLKIRKNLPSTILVAFLLLLSIMMLLPFCWVISTSLRPPMDSFKMPPSFFPTSFQYQNYLDLFTRFPFFSFILNSMKIALSVVFLNVIVSTMAGYAFARIPFKGKNLVFLIILSGMMIPAQATLIPSYIILAKLGFVGTHWSLILPAIVTPLNIFFVRQYMMTIPSSYEEAAYIDGAGRFRIYFQIFLPMSKSVIIMTLLLTFLASWNNFIAPLIYLSRWELMTLPLGLSLLSGKQNTGSIAVILAGVTTSLVVPTLLYIFGQRYILESVALSGLKS